MALVQLEREACRDIVSEPGDQRRHEDLAHVEGVLSGQGQQSVAAVERRALQLGRAPALGGQLRGSVAEPGPIAADEATTAVGSINVAGLAKPRWRASPTAEMR